MHRKCHTHDHIVATQRGGITFGGEGFSPDEKRHNLSNNVAPHRVVFGHHDIDHNGGGDGQAKAGGEDVLGEVVDGSYVEQGDELMFVDI